MMEIWQKLVSQQKNYYVFEKISLPTHNTMFPLVTVQVQHEEPGNMHL